ncbi:MAG: site-specific integrase [Fidelibacterota bacterium]
MTDPKRETVDQFLLYLAKEKHASPHTVQAYRNDLLQFCEFLNQYEGQITPHFRQVDKTTARHFLNYLMENEFDLRPGKRGKLGKPTVVRKLAAVKSFFKYLVRAEELPADPISSLKGPKQSRKLPVFLEEGFMKKVVDLTLPDSWEVARDVAMLEFFYSTGIRLSELVGLALGDVDFKQNLVKVMGKGAKERIVPFGDTAKNAVLSYLEKRSSRFGRASSRDPLFVSRAGARISSRTVQYRLRRLFDQLSVRLAPVPESWKECRDRAIVELYYSTRARHKDLTGLNMGDLTFERSSVLIRFRGKHGKTVSLKGLPRDCLVTYLRKQRLEFGQENEAEPLFTSRHGNRIEGAAIRNVVNRYGKTGVEFSPHLLRHTFATHLLDRGMNIRAVKELLGHASLSSTQLYTHLKIEQMKKEFDRAHPHA